MISGDIASGPVCPIPLDRYPIVTLAHGSGGKLSQQLIEEMFVATFDNRWLRSRHDAAVFQAGERTAFTTDSYVVSPRFFPGGDIGRLAIFGTVNDLAMAGASPRYLSLGLILEEGFSMAELWRIVCSIQAAANEAGVKIVTGDTKVVERGSADGLYVNTTGVGDLAEDVAIGPEFVLPGDVLLLSGDLGCHGMAIMAEREGLGFEPPIRSDCAPLSGPVKALREAEIPVHCLRDLTRGGLAAACHEIAEAGRITLELDEDALVVSDNVQGACEILGLDPLHIACEGRFLAIVPPAAAQAAQKQLRSHPLTAHTTLLGRVGEPHGGDPVVLNTSFGLKRPLDRPTGPLLPRIC